MSLSNIFNVAGSAMSAQAQRLNATASNIANADSATGPDGRPYKAKQVVFESIPVGDVKDSGVKVAAVVEDQAPPKLVYDPKHPMADGNGYVAMPNVNPVEEMVNMISASRSYQTNVETMNTAKAMLVKTLTIGQ
ncbi:flagellar basal body rod protein FlgC [Herbaspirillum sp. BH-1]|jgi:flagellar basal-body rod protein FlgC|uniref:Flagellar basal-body rod protein FlgC n=2 Tax=Herbaspirillum frisingense TaxID=92645 RepID=A0AAI9IGA6_9BURK|nr:MULTISPECIES: flagellar basal body rod protein FlgC [Herbaspirillum]EOA05577.1 flagellar basal-body rod protein [Herbaspirillum frisingense GSF30]MCI1014806.1 flagellar basal body rod protein FlgC [Herbaspirillum sp. C7C2]MDR6582071.1 flagellar basal-body rod protein FlgC [Herbaspirillum frisingense]ONN65441.1 flagellar basal body rod protein FlgC [Herbaspirillum sp. VT-16-41]PLY59407.1 flagellar basal body rod protein FlgC [Herbaspirillum sp. BH-1]